MSKATVHVELGPDVETASKIGEPVVDISPVEQREAYGKDAKNLTPAEISENRRMKLVMSGTCLIMAIVLAVSITSGIAIKEERGDTGADGSTGGGNKDGSTNGPTNAPTALPTTSAPTKAPTPLPTATPGAHDSFPELAAGQVDISTARFSCSQSNSEGSLARYAFDEAAATSWTGAAVDNQWVEIDSCCTTKLQRVDIDWGTDYATAYDVMASTDGEAWTVAASATGATGGVESVSVTTPVDARFVRLVFKSRSNTATGPSIISARLVGAGTCPESTCEAYMEPALSIATRTRNVMCRMSIEQKLAQMIQIEGGSPDIGMITEPNMGVGSVLSGGGAAPKNGNTADKWAERNDNLQRQAMSASPKIPLLYGVDAVHGHTNVMGATVFPHNINLGATRNDTLVRAIGAATAREVRATGIHWNFAPCLCIGTEPRWGRFYECFSDRPENVGRYASYIDGLQGTYDGGPGLQGEFSVMATAKHWIGDGGIAYGTGYKQRLTDQGVATMTEQELREIHMPPYYEAIAKQTGSIMASFNSLELTNRGETPTKMHGHTYMMKDVLRDELKFKGIMVSDWAGIDQIDGDDDDFSVAEVALWVNNHGDLAMVPYEGKKFLSRLQAALAQGLITEERVDVSVQRILRYKFELGLFENPYHNPAHLATQIRHPEHVKLAREAAQQSSVLLKNENAALPIAGRVLVMGRISEDLGLQCGGWTIDWQ
jgi:beta-glucosidase-like glycosyl hydrolase